MGYLQTGKGSGTELIEMPANNENNNCKHVTKNGVISTVFFDKRTE
jgi:hypothetical protein